MGKVEVKIKNEEKFKPINISVEITIEEVRELSQFKENLRELLDDWSFNSDILQKLLDDLYEL